MDASVWFRAQNEIQKLQASQLTPIFSCSNRCLSAQALIEALTSPLLPALVTYDLHHSSFMVVFEFQPFQIRLIPLNCDFRELTVEWLPLLFPLTLKWLPSYGLKSNIATLQKKIIEALQPIADQKLNERSLAQGFMVNCPKFAPSLETTLWVQVQDLVLARFVVESAIAQTSTLVPRWLKFVTPEEAVYYFEKGIHHLSPMNFLPVIETLQSCPFNNQVEVLCLAAQTSDSLATLSQPRLDHPELLLPFLYFDCHHILMWDEKTDRVTMKVQSGNEPFQFLSHSTNDIDRNLLNKLARIDPDYVNIILRQILSDYSSFIL